MSSRPLPASRRFILARELQPLAITLDVVMPGMDGWAVLTAIKTDPELADIPVIMMSVVDDRNIGFALGASAFLTKPLDRSALVDAMKPFGTTSGRSILIVEDDRAAAELVSRTLADEGWQVRIAQDGQAGLRMMREQAPSLIVLDLMMPLMDGFEFAAELRRHEPWRSIPVVVLTAKELTEEDRRRSQRRRAAGPSQGGGEAATISCASCASRSAIVPRRGGMCGRANRGRDPKRRDPKHRDPSVVTGSKIEIQTANSRGRR
jgi:CheY-like chemotaxis protein